MCSYFLDNDLINIFPGLKSGLTVSKALTTTERSEISEPIVSSSSAKLSAPLFRKKVKSSDGVKSGNP